MWDGLLAHPKGACEHGPVAHTGAAAAARRTVPHAREGARRCPVGPAWARAPLAPQEGNEARPGPFSLPPTEQNSDATGLRAASSVPPRRAVTGGRGKCAPKGGTRKVPSPERHLCRRGAGGSLTKTRSDKVQCAVAGHSTSPNPVSVICKMEIVTAHTSLHHREEGTADRVRTGRGVWHVVGVSGTPTVLQEGRSRPPSLCVRPD